MTHRRLDQILVHRGIGSRTEVRKLIRRGIVSVDGQVCRDAGQKFGIQQSIMIGENESRPLPALVLWHKPVGIICTSRDPWGRRDLDGVLPPSWAGHFHPVGRLDADTSGLLVFSRLGKLTQWLLHPKRAVVRRYIATVDGVPDATLAERLAHGIETSLGVFPATVERIDEATIELTVKEGKHRMVRRILANAGHPVLTLQRIEYGPMSLGELESESWRALNEEEYNWLLAHKAPLDD